MINLSDKYAAVPVVHSSKGNQLKWECQGIWDAKVKVFFLRDGRLLLWSGFFIRCTRRVFTKVFTEYRKQKSAAGFLCSR